MPIISRLVFQVVRWAARRGLGEEANFSSAAKKLEARSTGVRGETYAYWYLRRQGYVFVAKNYTPRGIKGELDLIGYDGKTLAFVEVRTRTVKEDAADAAGTQRYPREATDRGSHCAALSRRAPRGRVPSSL